jgi:electron transfer flavoprotein alpha subunit
MTALVLAEHDGKTLNPATARTVTAARATGETVHILVAGEDCAAIAAAAAKLAGVAKVLLADDAVYRHNLAEPMADLLAAILEDGDSVFAAATAAGVSILPRLAALRDAPQVSEILAVVAPRTFVRPIYAGSLLETVAAPKGCLAVTVQAAAFAPAGEQAAATIEKIQFISNTCLSTWREDETPEASGRPDLATARIVIAGGRGIGSREGFARLKNLADRLGAAVGASRAAVDAGLVSNDCQVGQNGKVVAPELYVALGISGAIQHLAGLRGAKLIAAVNKDAEAPIFRIADIGLIADLDTVLPEMEKALAKFGL